MPALSDRLHALRDAPAYHVADAAAYVGVPASTLRSWIGRSSAPRLPRGGVNSALIVAADQTQGLLSFNNLVEAHILRIFRQIHNVRLPSIRVALEYASRDLNIPRPLLSRKLETDGVGIFIEHLGHLTDLSASGAIYLRSLLSAQLHRVDWDDSDLAYRLYPRVEDAPKDQARVVAIDPSLSFGRPLVLRRAIATAAIVSRIDLGESVAEVADDYDLTLDEVNAAVMFEHQAA